MSNAGPKVETEAERHGELDGCYETVPHWSPALQQLHVAIEVTGTGQVDVRGHEKCCKPNFKFIYTYN